mgnify:CR=1 FL=1
MDSLTLFLLESKAVHFSGIDFLMHFTRINIKRLEQVYHNSLCIEDNVFKPVVLKRGVQVIVCDEIHIFY